MKTFVSLSTLFAIISFQFAAADDYGYQFSNAFSTGPVATNSFIREANTTLVLPAVNSGQKGNLALWPGMGTSGGDLIQGLAISVGDNSAGCANSKGKWCIVASTLQGTQKMGAFTTAVQGDNINFHYIYNDNTAAYDQTVSLNGKVVSTLSTKDGKAQGWGTAIECQQAACGTIGAHQYLKTTLLLDVADPSYSKTLGKTGASGDLITKDGGKTWTAATISIQGHTYV